MKLLGKQTVVAVTTYVVVCLFALFLFPGPIERLNSALLNFQLPAESSTNEVVIIAIDEQSFAALDTQWPWPREYHGMLVERLLEEGAKKIIFDVVFAEVDCCCHWLCLLVLWLVLMIFYFLSNIL